MPQPKDGHYMPPKEKHLPRGFRYDVHTLGVLEGIPQLAYSY